MTETYDMPPGPRRFSSRGFSLVEILISIGILSGLTLSFTTIAQGTFAQQNAIDRRLASLDMEQTIGGIFLTPSVCKCNFKDIRLLSDTSVNLPDGLNYYSDPLCTVTSATPLVVHGGHVPGANGLRVDQILLTRFHAIRDGALKIGTADLQIKYSVENGPAARDSTVLGLMFNIDASNKITDCVATGTVQNSEPRACGLSQVCWNGKVINFTNASSLPVAISVESYDALGFTAMFRVASGRTTLLRFNEVGGVLVPTPPAGWRPQLCYNHVALNPPGSHASDGAHFGVVGAPNCGSGIYWSGDYVGDTTTLPGYTAI